MILQDDGDMVNSHDSDSEQEDLSSVADNKENIVQLVKGDVFVI